MRPKDVREQHIAVFGESGSGKTVLVSSFYGATQEPDFQRSNLFDVVADDTGQGYRLHANYLGMRNAAQVPAPTRFSSTPYAFSVKLRSPNPAASSARSFDSVRLVWHDYPGEWFEKDVSGPEEAQRRVDTFRSLLGSDVAFLLVDGQRLLDHVGEEERYLKSLLGSYRTGLLRLRDQLLDDGRPLVRFPRIWVLALSKADLLPELDVYGFRDLIIARAADDLDELRRVLEGLVDSREALSVGEDFVRLSSARFEPNRISVSERIGIDLILPLAAYLPFERHLKWIQRKQISTRLAEQFRSSAAPLAILLTKKAKILKVGGPAASLVSIVASRLAVAAIDAAAELTSDQLRKLNEDALARKDDMRALLAQFALDLDRGEEDRVLLRSKR
jgi:hypothetical protein